jgi:Cyclin, C-terminal domain
MKEKPSKIASMGLYAALKLMRSGNSNNAVWNSTLTKNSGFKEDEIKEMSMDMV